MMEDLRLFNMECLAAHNGIRKAHNVDKLVYDRQLSEASQKYAELLAESESLEHSKNFERPNIGENLAFSYKPYVNYIYSGRGATVSWYSEIKDYDFSKEKQKDGNPVTGHFTQVVWKSCKSAGFGRAQGVNKGWFIVGRYAPCGNVLSYYLDNVTPLSYSNWEDVPVVYEYLEELRTMEYTSARKHVLDNCTSKTQVKTTKGIRSFTITETFDSLIYGTYSASAEFPENPTKMPRPEFQNQEIGKCIDEDTIVSTISSAEECRLNIISNDDMEDFRSVVLRRHNFYRHQHNVPPLQLDDSLSQMAQDWAEQLANESSLGQCNCQYNSSEVGENICSVADSNIIQSGEKTIDRWYSEESFYSYKGEPENFGKVGHFTQVVWRNSKKLGIGLAENSTKINYFVCFYYPPGNVVRGFAKNILKPNVQARR